MADDTGGFAPVVPADTGGFTLQRTPEGLPFLQRGQAPAPTLDTGGFSPIAPAGLPPSSDTGGFAPAVPPAAGGPSLIEKMLEPITSYFPTQHAMQREGRSQISEGIGQFGEGERLKGAFNVGMGVLGYGMSPISAGLRSLAGKPIEENLGIPKEYTEFGLGLALPGVGLAKAPKTLQALVSPETVSPQAMEAASLLRRYTGPAARSTQSTAASLEAYEPIVNALPPAEQFNIMKYVGGAPSAVPPATPSLRALADQLRAGFKERRTELENLPQTAQMHFIEDYFPQFWKDPNAARALVVGPSVGIKQGSGASLKARTMPTLDDGIRAGLEPLFTNPIEAAMHYFASMDKFIASTKILNEAVDSGVVRYVRPRVVGASGHPDSFKVPQGYVPIQGRGATNAAGAKAYAPEDWARVYNNFISRGWEQIGTGEYGKTYDMLRKGSNAMTQALLSFSGYHAFTMAEASLATQTARIAEALRAGRPVEAAKEMVKVPFAPVSYAVQGKKLKDAYLGKSLNISPQDREIIDLITQAGGRMAGMKHALDYQSSQMGSYLNSFRRGKLASEFKEYAQWIRGRPIVGSAQVVASTLGRTMDQWNQPLFQHYIPAMKNGAAAGNLAQWMKFHPNATQAEKLQAARQIVDSVDNRFGEMIHDNIFWNKVAKQSAMLGMISYSWNMGGIREIGGGLRDMARFGVGKSEWTPKANYVVSTALTWGMLNAIYQYIKTGEAPAGIEDLLAARTGGIDERSKKPERIIPPGIMKDVFAYWEHFGQEAVNKIGPGPKMAFQTGSILGGMGGSDWRGNPILSPKRPGQTLWNKVPEWLADYFRFVVKTLSPIQAQNITKGKQIGSNLSDFEKLLGIRTAPRQLIASEQQHRKLDRTRGYQWRRKMKQERRELRLYE